MAYDKMDKVLVVMMMMMMMARGCQALECFECSDFPREVDSLDEEPGQCPGWLRPPKHYGDTSIYDGCMSVLLANGSIVSQNAIILENCLKHQKDLEADFRSVFKVAVSIRCCHGEMCNVPKRERWRILQWIQKKQIRNARAREQSEKVLRQLAQQQQLSSGGKEDLQTPGCVCANHVNQLQSDLRSSSRKFWLTLVTFFTCLFGRSQGGWSV